MASRLLDSCVCQLPRQCCYPLWPLYLITWTNEMVPVGLALHDVHRLRSADAALLRHASPLSLARAQPFLSFTAILIT